LRKRRWTSSGCGGGVVGLGLVIPLNNLLHLQVVFLCLDESILEDGKSLILDIVVDGGQIGYYSEAFGMSVVGC
jgi:hypothetical protein